MDFDSRIVALYSAGLENALPSPPSVYSQESLTGISEVDISWLTNTQKEPSPEDVDVSYFDQFHMASLVAQDIFALLDNGLSRKGNKSELFHTEVSAGLPPPLFGSRTPTQDITPVIPKSLDSEHNILPSVTQMVLIDSAEGLVTSSSLADDSSSRSASSALVHNASLGNNATSSELPKTYSNPRIFDSLLDAAFPSSQVLLNFMIPSVNNDTSSLQVPPAHVSGSDLKPEICRSRSFCKEARSVIPSLPVRRNAQKFDDAVSVSPSEAIMNSDQLSCVAPYSKSWLPTASKDSPARWFDSPLSLTPTVLLASFSDIGSSGSECTPAASPQVPIPDSLVVKLHESSNSSHFQHTHSQYSQSTRGGFRPPSKCSFYSHINGTFLNVKNAENLLSSAHPSIQHVVESPLNRISTIHVVNDSSKNMSHDFFYIPSEQHEEYQAKESLWKKLKSKASRIFRIQPKAMKSVAPSVRFDKQKPGLPSTASRIFNQRIPECAPAIRLKKSTGTKQADSCQLFGYHGSDCSSTTPKNYGFTEYAGPLPQNPYAFTDPFSLSPFGANLQKRQDVHSQPAWTIRGRKRFSMSVPEGLDFIEEPPYMMRR